MSSDFWDWFRENSEALKRIRSADSPEYAELEERRRRKEEARQMQLEESRNSSRVAELAHQSGMESQRQYEKRRLSKEEKEKDRGSATMASNCTRTTGFPVVAMRAT